jgi:hypothetical protein
VLVRGFWNISIQFYEVGSTINPTCASSAKGHGMPLPESERGASVQLMGVIDASLSRFRLKL